MVGSLLIVTPIDKAVVGFWKVVRPLNAVDVQWVPKARVGGEHERAYVPPLVRGVWGISHMKILELKMTKEAIP